MSGTASSTLHERLSAVPADPQDSSPLFNHFPAEIRTEIFRYALTDYPDLSPEKQYDTSTCYTRPAYFAPSRTDTQLLQTCRAIYQECWFMPCILREYTHWLTNEDRAPPKYLGFHSRPNQDALDIIAEKQEAWTGRPSDGRAEVDRMRVFAQMFKLEEDSLSRMFRTQQLSPRELTICIRHQDWWFWEDDTPLRFEGSWILPLARHLPASVRVIHVEMESLERKKSQVQEIAKQMEEKWFFKRADGNCLFAHSSSEGGWRGNSKWHGRRWVRDETSEGVIDYYIKIVTFKLGSVIEKAGGTIHPTAKANSQNESLSAESLKLHRPEWRATYHPNPWVGGRPGYHAPVTLDYDELDDHPHEIYDSDESYVSYDDMDVSDADL